MELRINSNASIKLDKFTGVNKINTRITEFVCKNDTLEGNMLILGNYFQNDLDNKIDFKEVIPFTVVFKDNNYLIKDITCENFSYGEVVGRGLDCNFDVVVFYDLKKEDVNPEIVEDANIEGEARNENNLEVDNVNFADDREVDDFEETIEIVQVEELPEIASIDKPDDSVSLKRQKTKADLEIELSSEETEVIELDETKEAGENYYNQNELIKEDITKHVDKILQAKMEVKTDNDPSKKFSFGRGADVKSTIKVIYYRDSNEIESICHQNELSIDKVFKDNKDTNFDLHRRILIK